MTSVLKETGTKRIIELCKTKIISIYTSVLKEYNRVAALAYNFFTIGTYVNRQSYHAIYYVIKASQEFTVDYEITESTATSTKTTWGSGTLYIGGTDRFNANREMLPSAHIYISTTGIQGAIFLPYALIAANDAYLFEGVRNYTLNNVQYSCYVKILTPVKYEHSTLINTLEVRQ